MPQPVVGQVWSVPAFMAADAASSLAWTSGRVTFVTAEAPMPSFVALKSVGMVPPLAIAWTAWVTADTRCFSALVMMHLSSFGSEMYWSTSTPTPQMPAAQAASRTPLPVRPATAKRTSGWLAAMKFWANALPPTGSLNAAAEKSWVTYADLTVTFGLTDFAPSS